MSFETARTIEAMPQSAGDVPMPLRITLLLVASLTIMAGTIVAPALPAISERFAGTPNVDLLSRMVLTLPALAVVVWAPVAGTLADRFGRRKLLALFVLLYAVAGSSGLFADSLAAVLTGRVFLGVAIGGIMTIGAALIGDYFEGEARGRFFGLQQSSVQFGGVIFVILGGQLADIGWRAPFAVYALAFLILPAVLLFVTEPQREKRSAITLSDLTPRSDWGRIALIGVTAFLINMLFYTVPAQIGFYLRTDLGLPRPSMAGWAIGAMNVAAAITALNYARLRRRMGVTAIFALSLSLVAVGAFALSRAEGGVGALAALMVMGLGLGPCIPNIMAAALGAAAPQARARITGLITSSMFLGHFVSPVASQPVIAGGGYRLLYAAVAGVFAAMALAAWAVTTRGRGAPMEG